MPALTAAGAAGFWVANLAISLTPIAAEYRAALSIPYGPMLLEALLGGLVIGACVSVALLLFEKVPTEHPVTKSTLLSLVALILVTLLVEVPAKFGAASTDPVRYFLIGTGINVVRIAALGAVVGFLHGRLSDRAKG
ncbi:MAG: hypothetical protein ACTHJL_03745 [Amnibacterium sp.]